VILTLIIFLAVLLLWVFGSRELADLKWSFDENSLGADLDNYLKTAESKLPDIVPGTEKRIIWHGKPHQKTPVSIVYLHGFSASSEEIRPVPDQVAQSLGANLYFARLTGHGRSGGQWLTQQWPVGCTIQQRLWQLGGALERAYCLYQRQLAEHCQPLRPVTPSSQRLWQEWSLLLQTLALIMQPPDY